MMVNTILNEDCMNGMRSMEDNSVDFTLTDIPYNEVNRKSNGLRLLDKNMADILEFDLNGFLSELCRVTKNSICIFCGTKQFSDICKFFSSIGGGTVRPIVWEKTNPSPMNGQYVYVSGIELAVWYKKKGAKTFNAHCKNTVFRYSSGQRKIHPTQKNVNLFKELILDNTNEGDVVFDPCMGSGTTAIASMETGRNFFGHEMNEEAYTACMNRIGEYRQRNNQTSFL